MKHFVVISGCSGGGKSTLLSELRRRGHAVIEEPGRRVVQQEERAGGKALPWLDMEAFLRRAIDVALEDYANASYSSSQWVFFDRGLIDAAAALQALTGDPILEKLSQQHHYHSHVFLAPPWAEIYAQDAERRHDMTAAVCEFERLQNAYPALGYAVSLLPKVSVIARADFVLATLGIADQSRACYVPD
ncbi:AAA family ATPase [Pseudomonas mosselii]|uniref:AAA family ATPase n=1 Tax=Pseudomonas mosselii TaxID=78327 RepID=UPI002B0569CD|nr:AAA family ATPase [Pseudomonas mosselii]MEA3233914.1 AAA family ATPase [Pseudomonas mosselii]